MDLTFQIPLQYCSLQHRTLLSLSDTSTTGYCSHFGSASSFLLELFLCSSPVVYWGPTDLGGFLLQYPFILLFSILSYCSWGSQTRILKWFAIPFSSGSHSVRPLHHDPPVLGGPKMQWRTYSMLNPCKFRLHLPSFTSSICPGKQAQLSSSCTWENWGFKYFK